MTKIPTCKTCGAPVSDHTRTYCLACLIAHWRFISAAADALALKLRGHA